MNVLDHAMSAFIATHPDPGKTAEDAADMIGMAVIKYQNKYCGTAALYAMAAVAADVLVSVSAAHNASMDEALVAAKAVGDTILRIFKERYNDRT